MTANPTPTWTKLKGDEFDLVIALLSMLHDSAHALPFNRTPETLKKGDHTQALNYALSLADNDSYWAAAPERIVPTEADKADVRLFVTFTSFFPHAFELENGKTAFSVSMEFAAGKPKDYLRKRLGVLLAACV